MRKLTLSSAIAGVALLLFSPVSQGQIVKRTYWSQTFISKEYREGWSDRYENFGNYDMRRYPRTRKEEEGINKDMVIKDIVKRGHVTPVTYDPFGNFLLPGGEIVSMEWNRSKLGANYTQDDAWASSVFNNLMICSDEFSNWQTRFILSQGGYQRGIRAYFTPSTLKMTNFGGFRWDLSSRKNNVTVLASAGDQPIYGVHWQSVLGDILKIGASYVGRQRGTVAYSHQDIDGSNISPTNPNYIKDEPKYVYVIVTDDSPEDTGPGALVYGIKAFVNGKQEEIAFKGENYPVKGRMFKIPSIITQRRFLGDEFVKQYVVEGDSEFLHGNIYQLRNNKGSWFKSLANTNILNDLFHKSGEANNQGLINVTTELITGDANDRFDPDVPGSVEYQRYYKADTSQGVVEARGTDLVIYEILIPTGTRSLSFNLNVANDYCIDVVAPLSSNRQNRQAGWYDKPLSEEWKGSWSINTYDYKHCKKAPGNVKDGSNQHWERVTYDRLTGMNVYGMNMELNWRGLFVRAEYNENTTFWSYPVNDRLSGEARNEYKSRAWFINAEKDFGKWSVGTELFNYPNEYQQYWSTIDDNDDNDRSPQYSAYDMSSHGMAADGYTSYMDIDFDRYQDYYFFYDANDLSDPDDDVGVPFLNYYYDSVAAGDDFDHDGVIDSRKNDADVDLPYERDSRGQHYFMKIRPKESTILSFGHYDVKQEYMDGRNFTRYLKLEHFQRLKGLGEFLLYHRTERVKDDYNLSYNYSYHRDNHNLINNWKFTNVLSTRMTAIPNTNVINNVQFNTTYNVGNLRKTDGTQDEVIENLLSIYDGSSLVSKYGGYDCKLEHKVDYTLKLTDARILPSVSIAGFRLWGEKRIKELKFMPMFKMVHTYGYLNKSNYTLQTRDRRPKMMHIYPIVRFDYRVAPKTLLRFGIQGFPGLPEIYRTKTAYSGELEDFDKRNMILAFENQTLYEGFNLLVMMGMRFSKTKYINDISKKDPGSTEYFITLQSEASG